MARRVSGFESGDTFCSLASVGNHEGRMGSDWYGGILVWASSLFALGAGRRSMCVAIRATQSVRILASAPYMWLDLKGLMSNPRQSIGAYFPQAL